MVDGRSSVVLVYSPELFSFSFFILFGVFSSLCKLFAHCLLSVFLEVTFRMPVRGPNAYLSLPQGDTYWDAYFHTVARVIRQSVYVHDKTLLRKLGQTFGQLCTRDIMTYLQITIYSVRKRDTFFFSLLAQFAFFTRWAIGWLQAHVNATCAVRFREASVAYARWQVCARNCRRLPLVPVANTNCANSVQAGGSSATNGTR